MKKALLVIDVQNDFLPGGALAVPHGEQVISVANRLMPSYELVVATQDWHPADHLSFASQHEGKQVGDTTTVADLPQLLWPDHCIQGTEGAQFAAELNVARLDHVVQKGTDREIDSYSGFFDNGHRRATGLHDFLQSQSVTTLELVGLATDYCVRYTAQDALQLGYDTRILVPGVRGVDLQPGDSDNALADLQSKGVILIS